MKEYINNLLFFSLGVILTLGVLKKYLDHDTILILVSVGIAWCLSAWYHEKEKNNTPKAVTHERIQSQRFVHQKNIVMNIKNPQIIPKLDNVVDLNSYRKQKASSSFNRVIS